MVNMLVDKVLVQMKKCIYLLKTEGILYQLNIQRPCQGSATSTVKMKNKSDGLTLQILTKRLPFLGLDSVHNSNNNLNYFLFT